MTSARATAFLDGKTVGSTMVNGKMENNTELAFSPQKIIKLKKENGKMVEKLGGSIDSFEAVFCFF